MDLLVGRSIFTLTFPPRFDGTNIAMRDIPPLLKLPTITIRSYRQDDFDHAYRLIREIGTPHLGKDLRSWDKVFMELSGFMWVANVEETPIAFAGMSLPYEGLVYLHTDLVSPLFQRRGIGTVMTLTRFAALLDDEVERIGVLATEHSAPFYARFGFQLEAEPQRDPFAGYSFHRMSVPFSPALGQSADSLLESFETVTFDTTTDVDPFAED
jgi:N-acetylglutamate synthase-like GNAT family acetyltransferase